MEGRRDHRDKGLVGREDPLAGISRHPQRGHMVPGGVLETGEMYMRRVSKENRWLSEVAGIVRRDKE